MLGSYLKQFITLNKLKSELKCHLPRTYQCDRVITS